MSVEPRTTLHGSEGDLAPRWHTALLIGLMLAVALTGALLMSRGGVAPAPPDANARIKGIYMPMLVVQWSLVFYVSRIGRPRNALPVLLGKRPKLRGVCADIVLASAAWLAIEALEFAWTRWVGLRLNGAVATILPHTVVEKTFWVAVALSVGFCEEVVYRGYLQQQLTAFSGSAGVAIALQAALFGIAHGEQGAAATIRLGVYALILGVLARWRHSLLPGILCHMAIDLTSGFVS